MKTTLQVVANAIRANGKQQAFGTAQKFSNGKVVAACALQQGADNLKVPFNALFEELNNIFVNNVGLGEQIVSWNDSDRLSLADIADRIETEYEDYLGESVRA